MIRDIVTSDRSETSYINHQQLHMSHLFGLLLRVVLSSIRPCLAILRGLFCLLCLLCCSLGGFFRLLHAHRLNSWAICRGSGAVYFFLMCSLHLLVRLETRTGGVLLLVGCGVARNLGAGGGVMPDGGLPAHWVLAQGDATWQAPRLPDVWLHRNGSFALQPASLQQLCNMQSCSEC